MTDAVLPSLIGDTETGGETIMVRWAVAFALLMAAVFALSYGYHLGAAYMDRVLAR